MKHIDINQFNCWAKSHIIDDSKFDKNVFVLSKNNTNFKSTEIISRTFENHWENYYHKYSKVIDVLRPNANRKLLIVLITIWVTQYILACIVMN